MGQSQRAKYVTQKGNADISLTSLIAPMPLLQLRPVASEEVCFNPVGGEEQKNSDLIQK